MKRELEYVQGPSRDQLKQTGSGKSGKIEDIGSETGHAPTKKERMWHFMNKEAVSLLMSLEKLNEPYPRFISSETGIPYEQAIESLEQLESVGYVRSSRLEGERYFELTPLGAALSGKFQEIEKVFLKWPDGGQSKLAKFQREKVFLRGF